MVAVPSFDSAAYCTMATVGGRVKRIQLSELASVRPSGLMAIGLERGRAREHAIDKQGTRRGKRHAIESSRLFPRAGSSPSGQQSAASSTSWSIDCREENR